MVEDINLIKEVLNKNYKAEKLFFDKYRKIIKNFLKNKFSKIVIDDIDDYVSDILIKVYENLNKYNIKFNFKTWVLTIAKHHMIDVWRNNAITIPINNIILDENDDENNYCTTTGCLTFNENSSFSTSCIVDFENNSSISYISSQLSPEDYTLLTMKYIQGYDYNEIAQEFNLTSSTISNKVNYIKTKLKKINLERDS
jgi:RNA polymerase sigma-70 factor (ECF subfamily)